MPTIHTFQYDDIDHNRIIYYSGNKNPIEQQLHPEVLKEKIYMMFHSPHYIYKIDVKVMLKNGTMLKKSIVGFHNNELYTIDDTIIPINEIADIQY